MPACLAQQSQYTAIAIATVLSGQGDDVLGQCPRRRPVVMVVVVLAETEDLRCTVLLERMDNAACVFS